jgi:amidase
VRESQRAAIAQQLTNCLTEIMFTEAMSRARWLDEQYAARGGKPVGPLHGVPVSLKDTFRVSGYDASVGIASLAFEPARGNSLLVDILLEAGVVLYVKTNVPQTMMSLDSDNNLFGRTMNPRNRRVTAGGSSGGEGALIAMRGSVLGIGTDVGGSIRIPAMCNGLYGLKPSNGRMPYVGLQSLQLPAASKLALPASAGPISASLRDCELLMRVVSGARPWERDPEIRMGKWEDMDDLDVGVGEKQRRPVIGVVWRDGLIEPLPPVLKVLEEIVGKLKENGVDVVELDIPQFQKCQSLANALFGVDGGNFVFDLLEKTGEPLVKWLSTRLRRKKPLGLDELRQLHARRTELETEFLKIWKTVDGKRVDAFICPVAPHPVPPIDRWNGVSYTSSFVLLDYPAGTVPVRSFQESDLKGDMSGEPLSGWDKVNRELCKSSLADSSYLVSSKLTGC